MTKRATERSASRRARAQSATEFFMTYGWAIMIVAIIIAILIALGIFNLGSGASRCIPIPGFVCKDPVYTTNTITFNFGQNTGHDYYGNWVFVASQAEELSSWGVPINFTGGVLGYNAFQIGSGPNHVTIPGQITSVTFPYFIAGDIPPGNPVGINFAGYVWLGYCTSQPCPQPTQFERVATMTLVSVGGGSYNGHETTTVVIPPASTTTTTSTTTSIQPGVVYCGTAPGCTWKCAGILPICGPNTYSGPTCISGEVAGPSCPPTITAPTTTTSTTTLPTTSTTTLSTTSTSTSTSTTTTILIVYSPQCGASQNDVVFSVNTKLTCDLIAHNVTIRPGIIVDECGFVIQANSTLTNYGTISDTCYGGAGSSETVCQNAGFSGPIPAAGAGKSKVSRYFGRQLSGGGGGGCGGQGGGGGGGAGGNGGNGGGIVQVYAANVINYGVINASGGWATNGQTAYQNGAGGGGGGAGGGYGSILIGYASPIINSGHFYFSPGTNGAGGGGQPGYYYQEHGGYNVGSSLSSGGGGASGRNGNGGAGGSSGTYCSWGFQLDGYCNSEPGQPGGAGGTPLNGAGLIENVWVPPKAAVPITLDPTSGSYTGDVYFDMSSTKLTGSVTATNSIFIQQNSGVDECGHYLQGDAAVYNYGTINDSCDSAAGGSGGASGSAGSAGQAGNVRSAALVSGVTLYAGSAGGGGGGGGRGGSGSGGGSTLGGAGGQGGSGGGIVEIYAGQFVNSGKINVAGLPGASGAAGAQAGGTAGMCFANCNPWYGCYEYYCPIGGSGGGGGGDGGNGGYVLLATVTPVTSQGTILSSGGNGGSGGAGGAPQLCPSSWGYNPPPCGPAQGGAVGGSNAGGGGGGGIGGGQSCIAHSSGCGRRGCFSYCSQTGAGSPGGNGGAGGGGAPGGTGGSLNSGPSAGSSGSQGASGTVNKVYWHP